MYVELNTEYSHIFSEGLVNNCAPDQLNQHDLLKSFFFELPLPPKSCAYSVFQRSNHHSLDWKMPPKLAWPSKSPNSERYLPTPANKFCNCHHSFANCNHTSHSNLKPTPRVLRGLHTRKYAATISKEETSSRSTGTLAAEAKARPALLYRL